MIFNEELSFIVSIEIEDSNSEKCLENGQE